MVRGGKSERKGSLAKKAAAKSYCVIINKNINKIVEDMVFLNK